MSAELTVVIMAVGFAVFAVLFLVAGAWAYKICALQRELEAVERRLDDKIDKLEARLTERMNRIEDEQKRMLATFQTSARDQEGLLRRIEAKLGKEKP